MLLMLALILLRRALAIADKGCKYEKPADATSTHEKDHSDVEEIRAGSLSDQYTGPVFVRRAARTIEPFILSHDLPRGILYALQAVLAYTLMLAVMCVLSLASSDGAPFPSRARLLTAASFL